MSGIIEEAMKLPKDEKMKLYRALQDELEQDDNILGEDELTEEQWSEINKPIADIKSGKAKLISKEELNNLLKERRHSLYNLENGKAEALS